MATAGEPSPTDDLLKILSQSARGDDQQVRELVERTGRRIKNLAVDEVKATLKRLPGGAAQAQAPAMPPRPAPVPLPNPPLGSVPPVAIKLANGRTVRVASAGAAARRDDLAAVARVAAQNSQTAFASLNRHERAICALEACLKSLEERVRALEDQNDKVLFSLLDGMAGLTQKIQDVKLSAERALASETRSLRSMVSEQGKTLGSQLRSQALSAQLQKVTDAATSLQVAAFGQPGKLFSTDNLLIAGNQLFWGAIDPLLRLIGAWKGGGPSPFAVLAPVGSLVTSQGLLGNRQHVRFISGLETFDGTARTVSISLQDRIAPNLFSTFRQRTDVPVTLLAVDGTVPRTTARVVGGVLIFTAIPNATVFAGGSVLDQPPATTFPGATVGLVPDTSAAPAPANPQLGSRVTAASALARAPSLALSAPPPVVTPPLAGRVAWMIDTGVGAG
jgi:hypothetical protein